MYPDRIALSISSKLKVVIPVFGLIMIPLLFGILKSVGVIVMFIIWLRTSVSEGGVALDETLLPIIKSGWNEFSITLLGKLLYKPPSNNNWLLILIGWIKKG